MRVQDLIAAAAKIRVVTRFRTTVGLPGRLSARLQPNHPTDDRDGHCGVDSGWAAAGFGRCGHRHQSGGRQCGCDYRDCCGWWMRCAERFQIPVQSCVLAHVTTQMAALEAGAPVDLIFQSIAGTEAANRSFGVNLALLAEAHEAGQSLQRGASVRRRAGRRQRDVLRDRAGVGALGQRAPWRGSADAGGARLCGGAALQARCW